MIERYSRAEMKRIWDEDNVFDLWLQIEKAVCEAMTEQGQLPQEDMAEIRRAVFDKSLYKKLFEETRHDLVSFTGAVAASVGSAGRWIHYGITSNDVKDTALSMQLVQATDLLLEDIRILMDAIKKRALEHKDTPCVGRTHGVHAEPMSFGLKFALWWDEIRRHKERLKQLRPRLSVCMISGPVGSFSTVSPDIEESVTEKLNLNSPDAVSNQIIQRDRHAEYVSLLALLGATLEKIATEIRGLQRTEVMEVVEPFGSPGYVTKGSSSMPHKRNPEISERVCGLARLLRGYSSTALENVALWHERDISHSSAERIILPDASLATDYMLHIITEVVLDMKTYPDRMMRNLELTRGIVFSPRVMLALIEAGMKRDEAYNIVQDHALKAWEQSKDFRILTIQDPRITSAVPPEKLTELFDYSWYLRFIDFQFKRLGWNDNLVERTYSSKTKTQTDQVSST